ncbi:MAG: UTP--glucose-1-phosphate uridylyltransferase [Bifidobacterium pullorum]
MVEVAHRTDADRARAGHIVRDKATGRLLLREMSQVHDADKAAAQDIAKHPYFNTNSIWVRIDALTRCRSRTRLRRRAAACR